MLTGNLFLDLLINSRVVDCVRICVGHVVEEPRQIEDLNAVSKFSQVPQRRIVFTLQQVELRFVCNNFFNQILFFNNFYQCTLPNLK